LPFCNYFSSVFTIDVGTTNNVDDQENKILNETDLEISLFDVEFNDFSIFKALAKLNIYNLQVLMGYMLKFCSKQKCDLNSFEDYFWSIYAHETIT